MTNKKETKDFEFYQGLVDMFPDIIHSVDSDGRIIWCNKKAEELLGYSRDELIGMSVFDLYDKSIRNKVKTGFDLLKQKGTLNIEESILITKSGEKIEVEIRSFSQYDQNGKFTNTATISRDLREKQSMEKQMIQSAKLAAIGELSSSLAHDISNPLCSIQLYTELIKSKITDQETLTNIDTMEKTINNLSRLVTHMKNFARGTYKAEFLPVDIHIAIENAFLLTAKKLETSNVTILKNYNNGVVSVKGNLIELEQVFLNLFSNACDALIDTKDAKIEISTSIVEGEAIIDVKDNGSGIADNVKDKIFRAFFTTKPEGQGTGLGLSTASTIIKRHRGTLSLYDTGPAGSIFRINIPTAGN